VTIVDRSSPTDRAFASASGDGPGLRNTAMGNHIVRAANAPTAEEVIPRMKNVNT